ncbi:MAG TPA: family 16 glycoside hydrolase, partial [Bacteroidales bacterium]|nr:family 16 glycoside hydrolase [Bacteroidales bacterium]
MKINKIIVLCLSVLMFTATSFSQDNRTLETKVADLLARLPAHDTQLTDKLMEDMLSLGEPGWKIICDQVIPSGTGDDTQARFAIESFSRYLSKDKDAKGRNDWEKNCISYAVSKTDFNVRDFFMKQLQLVGGTASLEAMKQYIGSKEMCQPAVAVISAVGGSEAEKELAASLKNDALPCAAAVMNDLALMDSRIAVADYIKWAGSSDHGIRAAALNALAHSGSPDALPVLLDAAKIVDFRWEATGACSALLTYAKKIASAGDIKGMDKICRTIINKSRDKLNFQSKTEALGIYTTFHGINAMPYILKAASDQNRKYRAAAINMSLAIKGSGVVSQWVKYFKRATPDAKPEIIAMLGERADETALPLVNSALSDNDVNVRVEAAAALVKISGNKAVNSLINYMLVSGSDEDQEAARSALKTVLDNDNLHFLIPVLNEGPPFARISAVDLLAWSRNNRYFSDVLKYASSENEPLRAAAVKALASLAGKDDQNKLIELLSVTEKPEYIAGIQEALANAANQVEDPANRSSVILKAFKNNINKEKLIPVLAETGGEKALQVVLKEFEEGNPGMRDVCFRTLTQWKDDSASSALFSICASGNKTFEAPAFEGYVRVVSSSGMPDEEKLLLFRKIMPFAVSAARKNELLSQVGKLKTYQSLFYVSDFLDDPSTSDAAARAAMSIALPSAGSKAGMYGDLVRKILVKVMEKLQGQESEYDREMVNKYLADMPAGKGFEPIFNGKDLTGWHGLVENPIARSGMSPQELAKKQAEADSKVPGNWSVKDGCIWFSGEGDNLCTIKQYGDFEMLVDWKITKEGDSGIYLRGSPQVQIWDTSRVDVGAQVGSGGLYNNQVNMSKPLKVADNPVGDWNSFRIRMTGEKVSVWLNGELVTDNVTMENYWDRSRPIFPTGPIELQAH